VHGVVDARRHAARLQLFRRAEGQRHHLDAGKLFQFLEKPQRVMPGTKMTFAGVSDARTRADIIAYLKAN
jgi:cytochrome c2